MTEGEKKTRKSLFRKRLRFLPVLLIGSSAAGAGRVREVVDPCRKPTPTVSTVSFRDSPLEVSINRINMLSGKRVMGDIRGVHEDPKILES